MTSFNQAIPTYPPKLAKDSTISENTIKLKAHGTKPLKYQWLKNDEEINDGDRYRGSTTSELVVLGSCPQVKGIYKCQVTNRYGEIISRDVDYGKS